MRNIFWTLFFGLVSGVCVINAQTPTQTPTQGQESVNFIEEKPSAKREVNTVEGVLNPDLQDSKTLRLPRMRRLLTTKRDKELISVDKEDKSKYSTFLN